MDTMMVRAFGLDPSLTYLNHASFGAPLLSLMDQAEVIRREIGRDTAIRLWQGLREQLRGVADHLATHMALPHGELALVANSTEGNNAVAASYRLQPGDHVAVLATEYASVITCWQEWARLRRALCDVVPLALPTGAEQILHALGQLHSDTKVLIISAISSSSALRFPLVAIGEFCASRGIDMVVDAAHAVGHADDMLRGIEPVAVFGSLHKWLPIPRPTGFLWVAPKLSATRPALIALERDEPDFSDRFSWRGTWDPAPMLTIPAGVNTVQQWVDQGLIHQAEQLAEQLAQELCDAGAVPCGGNTVTAPRLRAFLVPGADAPTLEQHLYAADVRAWVGEDSSGKCILRIATHVYNTHADVERMVAVVKEYMRTRQWS